jgi:hypothetical protein
MSCPDNAAALMRADRGQRITSISPGLYLDKCNHGPASGYQVYFTCRRLPALRSYPVAFQPQ